MTDREEMTSPVYSSLRPCVEHLTKRLDALEELVLKQHDIIGVLIKAGQNVQKMLEEEE